MWVNKKKKKERGEGNWVKEREQICYYKIKDKEIKSIIHITYFHKK